MPATTTTPSWRGGDTRYRRGGADRRPVTVVIDALRLPDGVTCAFCRRARSVAEKRCPHCDALVRGRG